MDQLAPFHNFCNMSEHFIYSLSNKQHTDSEARIVSHYCNVLLAIARSSLVKNTLVKNSGQESALPSEMQTTATHLNTDFTGNS